MSKGADKSDFFAEKHKSDRLMFLEGDEDIKKYFKNGKAGSFFKMNLEMKILHGN